MNDVRGVIAEAIPCNIVYGRPQAADDIMRALTSAGYRILGPGEWDPETVEKCAEVAEKPHRFANGEEYPLPSGLACATAIRALAKEKQGC